MKSVSEVTELLKCGETLTCEFKSQYEPEKISRTLVAFANDWPEAGGGTLIIGVDDKTGTPVGLETNTDELQKKSLIYAGMLQSLHQSHPLYIQSI